MSGISGPAVHSCPWCGRPVEQGESCWCKQSQEAAMTRQEIRVALKEAQAENARLRNRVMELEKALKESERALDAILSFEEDNLLVVNWHLNGDTEPLNNFFYENGLMEALEMARAAIKPAGGE